MRTRLRSTLYRVYKINLFLTFRKWFKIMKNREIRVQSFQRTALIASSSSNIYFVVFHDFKACQKYKGWKDFIDTLYKFTRPCAIINSTIKGLL